MATELINVKVDLISLVDKAANKRTVIWKSKDGNVDEKKNIRFVKFAKQDDELRKVYGIVYSPNDIDTQGDYMKPKEIAKAQEYFMKSLTTTKKSDLQHNNEPSDDMFMCETWIIKSGDPLFPNDVDGWAYAVKINSNEIWNAIKKGDYTGFSMYGTGERVEEPEVSKSFRDEVKEFFTEIKKFISPNIMENTEVKLIKDFNSELNENLVYDYMYALQSSIRDIFEDEAITDKQTAIKTNLQQMIAKIESIEFAKAEIKKCTDEKGELIISKAGKVLSDENLKKLQTAFEAITGIINSATAAKSANQNNNNPMENKTDQAVVDAAVKKALDDAKAENEKVVKELNDKIEKLEKKDSGSHQEVETEVEKKDEVKKALDSYKVI